TSAGGLASADSFTGKDSLLSGPAGGVVGFSRAAEAAGFQKAIGFDMGGTSTDVSRYEGRFEYEFETEKAGVRIVAPMLAIETIAAGRGGPLTITDCNLLLGRIVPDHFPFTLDRQAAENRLSEIASQIEAASNSQFTIRNLQSSPTPQSALRNPQSPTTHPSSHTPHSALAEGFLRIANANMAAAIRSISLAKGYNPRDYCLVAFGAAAPQHACAVAAELGITKILIHPDAGVLSALGIGRADVIKHRTASVFQLLPPSPPPLVSPSFNLQKIFDDLEHSARSDVASEGIPQSRIETRRSLDLRYQGVDAPLTIPQPADSDYATAFTIEHRRLYGYVHENCPLEIVAAR
ncbi:MAG: hydantoinase, partial [Planctomycetia bacterium]|nr:hydantoinase [Planctomycetia bacterium]